MKRTKIVYRGVPVILDTDDQSYVEAFERDCKWDSPLLKFQKESKTDGKAKKPRR